MTGRLKTEVGRELATLLMLGGAALMTGRNMRERLAVFLVCFGLWDLTFYSYLKVLLDWPASLLTWDPPKWEKHQNRVQSFK